MSFSISHATVRFEEKLVLDQFSYTFLDRGVTCFFGPSGCGKSTLLDALCGFVPLEAGEVKGLQGKRIARVFQDNRLLPWFDAYTNVRAVVNNDEVARNALNLVGLEADAATRPDELSGGMQKRLGLARAYAFDGDVILLDEPTVGIDEESAIGILDTLMAAWQDRLVVLITHDHGLAVRYANHIVSVIGIPLEITDEKLINSNQTSS